MSRLSVDEAERGILARDRGVLARAITLVESTRDDDRRVGEELVARLLDRTGRALRVGVSGPPGVGKSTLLDALGVHLLGLGLGVAVLAVDPSSPSTGGSILGDKTRMPRLTADPRAYVRPSPASEHQGGVALRTREAMLLCEAFGFDVVLIETVGVGQSEMEVASLVDSFLLLAQAGAGDELQGIKRGIMEAIDIVAVNKADGEGIPAARIAVRDLSAALHFMRPRFSGWTPRAVMVSARTSEGIPELWDLVALHRRTIEASGELAELRCEQARRWMWTQIEQQLLVDFKRHPVVVARALTLEQAVVRGEVSASQAARELLESFSSAPRGEPE